MNKMHAPAGPLHGRSVLHAPVVRAASIQAGAFGAVLCLAWLAAWLGQSHLTLTTAVLLQGGLAALISRLRGLAAWWQLIQAAFPVALVGTLSLQLPPVVFLLAFIALTALYWTTFRTQVPF